MCFSIYRHYFCGLYWLHVLSLRCFFLEKDGGFQSCCEINGAEYQSSVYSAANLTSPVLWYCPSQISSHYFREDCQYWQLPGTSITWPPILNHPALNAIGLIIFSKPIGMQADFISQLDSPWLLMSCPSPATFEPNRSFQRKRKQHSFCSIILFFFFCPFFASGNVHLFNLQFWETPG